MATTRSQERSRSRRRPSAAAARSGARANGRSADAARRVREAGDGATETLHQVADKSKGPALVGGAALAAIAGGVALARNNRRGSKGISLPSIGKRRRGLHMPHIELPHVSMPHL